MSTSFEGWGISLCWWANIKYPEHVKNELINLLFSPDGLELNIARYNLGGGWDKLKSHTQLRPGALMPCIMDPKTKTIIPHNDQLQFDILQKAILKGLTVH
jgi:hypothetical protein